MSESLLPYFNSELGAISKLAGEFAAANPTVAERLRLTNDTVDDPHVERLLQGVAFLAARVQQRLDDEAPELSDAVLELLSPHLLAPVPSMMTVQLKPKAEANGPARVARGTMLQTQPVQGETLQYQTCHDVTLWPLVLERAKLSGLPLFAPVNENCTGAVSVLHMRLATTVPGQNFEQMELVEEDKRPGLRLRLYLRGSGSTDTQLLELLCTSTLSIALADGPTDPHPTFLPPTALAQVGFEADEAALPTPQRAFSGHRLLTEYFAFPKKFLYIELAGLEARSLVQAKPTMDVFIYLSRANPELERSVNEENFVLGATPAVNLFKLPVEQVTLDGTQSEWRVETDARRPSALEIYSIESVRYSSPNAPRPRLVPHFQRLHQGHRGEAEAEGMSWMASRRPAPGVLGGTETRLMLRDPQFNPKMPADGVLSIDALCCNRELPSRLPFGGGQPALKVIDPTAPVGAAECLSPPTVTLRPQLRERSGWRLVSHLALNHLGVTGGPQGALALREMLRLHQLSDTPETRLALDGLVSVDAQPGVARLPRRRRDAIVRGADATQFGGAHDDHPGSFARGINLTLTFEPREWTAGGLYILAGVLQRFFALQVSINSFVRTSVRLRGRSGAVAQWPARSGTRELL